MNMNNPLENLRQLTEAVRMAGADIAPTYIEYVQLWLSPSQTIAGKRDAMISSPSAPFPPNTTKKMHKHCSRTRFMPIKKIYIWEPCSIWPGNAE